MNQPPLNPDALEAASNAVRRIALGEVNSWDVAEAAITSYLAAALPEVTSVEELDQLPDMSAVLDGDGFVFQKLPDADDDSYWFIVGDTSSYYDRDIELPARVLYRPEVKP